MTTISEDTIRAYALENARKYNGKANPNAILNSLFVEGLQKSEIKNIMPTITKIISEIEKLSSTKQEEKYQELSSKIKKREIRTGLPELSNVTGKVVMRFAPFPSGPIHIGNTRQLILNDEYVKKYGGKLILVIDDTIGSENKPLLQEAYKLIPEGIQWLNCNITKPVIYKSDRIENYYKYAEELLQKGHLYVCTCNADTIAENKIQQKECDCRNLSVKEQLRRWEEMFTAPQGAMVVRLKTSMTDPDPAFRDRIMLRIVDRPHERIGTKYRVYPLLDFSWAIDDHLLGITHIVRGMDLQMETKVEQFIWNIYGWKQPEVIHTGFLEIDGVKISKSKGAKEVKEGTYTGWDDPRLWSVQSLEARGIQPEAIREFLVSQGIKKSNTKVPVDVLYAINKNYLKDTETITYSKTTTKTNITILMPDGKTQTGKIETTTITKLKKGQIIYLKSLGFAKIHTKTNDSIECFFTHK